MNVVYFLLLLAAAICFLVHMYTVDRNVGRVDRTPNLVSLGLFFWVLVPLIETARTLG